MKNLTLTLLAIVAAFVALVPTPNAAPQAYADPCACEGTFGVIPGCPECDITYINANPIEGGCECGGDECTNTPVVGCKVTFSANISCNQGSTQGTPAGGYFIYARCGLTEQRTMPCPEIAPAQDPEYATLECASCPEGNECGDE